MLEDAFRMLGLSKECTLRDVKKAYRSLAKENHPDLAADPHTGQAREERMARINGAYREITAYLKANPQAHAEEKEKEADDDYTLYKRGVKLYDRYSGSIAAKFRNIEMDIDKLLEKIRDIEAARECFTLLLKNYPGSDWAYDSEERLKKIELGFGNLETNVGFIRTHRLDRTARGTPEWKKKE
ncbi:MAG: hypothetical protein A2Y33_06675 [Spirochaetes bacterium GWF1_51_8]|nr:MAG: hypothetical protein A2Y33_06675 [Spirochaetes bacterium GWF1_51_8]